MANNLHEGIIVKPSGGRTTLNIPEVVGSDFEATTPPRTIVIDVDLAVVETKQRPPFRIDISEHLRVRGAEPPFSINMISYREDTYSAFQRPWTEEDPVVVMDSHGVITYNPSGTYLRNRLEIDIELADAANPASFRGAELGIVYQDPEEVDGRGMRFIAPGTDDDDDDDSGGFGPAPNNGQTGTLTVQMINQIIGDPEAAEEFWAAQGQYDGTCQVASIAGIMQFLGITLSDGSDATFENLQQLTQQTLDLTGLPVEEQQRIAALLVRGELSAADAGGVLGALPSILDHNGEPLYIQITYVDADGNTQVVSDLHPDTTNTDGSWSRSTVILDALGVDYYTGYAADFSTAIRALESGQGLLIAVDGYELWENNGEIIEQAQLDFDTINTSQTRQNHAAWLTGIGPNDAGEVGVFINDSVDLEGGTWYPLETFLSAWEDAEFAFIGVGDTAAPDAGLQSQYQNLQNRIDAEFSNLIGPGSHLPQSLRSEWANLKPQTIATEFPTLLPLLEEADPGFTEDLNMYLGALAEQREEVLERYGIDPELVKRIVDHIDHE